MSKATGNTLRDHNYREQTELPCCAHCNRAVRAWDGLVRCRLLSRHCAQTGVCDRYEQRDVRHEH